MKNDKTVDEEKAILLASHLKDSKSLYQYIKNQKLSTAFFNYILSFMEKDKK